ncbi:MAG: PQQ-dependent sugar dehydrogenase [Sphingomonadaceae bacterium]
MLTSSRPALALILSTTALALASCGYETTGDGGRDAVSTPAPHSGVVQGPFRVTEHGTFTRPWAAAFEPGTGRLFVTERSGTLKLVDPASGSATTVNGAPQVDFGGQGGLGDIAFAPDYARSRAIYLSWVEAGENDTRGAVVGRGTLACAGSDCQIEGLNVIWRQAPKVTGRGHFSHRIVFSPDGKHMFVASGDRQKLDPAQDNTNTLGTIVRLNLDGTAAAGNPVAANPEIWSYGHRNILGMAFDPQGRLWEVEHGPAGGDELNLVKPGLNYGWPVVSDGDHYDGKAIPDNATRPDLAKPALGWTPVIAPGNMIIYGGNRFGAWKGQALISGLSSKALVRVTFDGERAREAERYSFDKRLRAVVEGPDGALWVLEDGEGARLLKLVPAS